MKTYKNTRSTIKPISDTELLETKVFLYRNIHEITEDEFTGYEFDMIEYDKDEYIQSIKSRNDELTEAVADLIGGAV